MDIKELEHLRDRLAAATGPDRLLDRAIAETALGKKLKIIEVPKGHPVFQEGGGLEFMEAISGWTGIPPYTASIDAAVTLVPEGLWYMACTGRVALSEPLYAVSFNWPDVDADSPQEVAAAEHAANMPLCFCLARIEYELAKPAK